MTIGSGAVETTRRGVVDSLLALGAPTDSKLMSRLLAGPFGELIPASRISALIECDPRVSEASPAPPRVIPVLDSVRFRPQRGLLALSTWPLEERISAPRSRRVFLLKVTRQLLAMLHQLGDADTARHIERLAVTVARSVRGAAEGWGGIDVERATKAIDAELAVLLDLDRPQREDAARRLRMLSAAEPTCGRAEARTEEGVT